MMLYGWLIIMTVMGSIAAYYLKKASGNKSIKSMLQSVYLYFGAGLYFLSALINVYLLRYLPYSVVLPLTSLTYIWTLFISLFKLGEKITRKKLVGVIAIFIGAIVISI